VGHCSPYVVIEVHDKGLHGFIWNFNNTTIWSIPQTSKSIDSWMFKGHFNLYLAIKVYGWAPKAPQFRASVNSSFTILINRFSLNTHFSHPNHYHSSGLFILINLSTHTFHSSSHQLNKPNCIRKTPAEP
jgi:hypothetical protein